MKLSMFTAEDWQKFIDWGIMLALGSFMVLFIALMLGIAVRVFFIAGGV